MKRPSYRKTIEFLATLHEPTKPAEVIAKSKSVRAVAFSFHKEPIEVAVAVKRQFAKGES